MSARLRLVLTVAAVAGLLVLAHFLPRSLGAYWTRVVNLGLIYATLAASLVLIFGLGGQFTLGRNALPGAWGRPPRAGRPRGGRRAAGAASPWPAASRSSVSLEKGGTV